MKIYYYDKILEDKELNQNNKSFAQTHKLEPHLLYLNDISNYLRAHATSDPEEADLFFVPLFLTGFQFMTSDPVSIINECEYLNRGRHIIVSTADCAQRAQSRHALFNSANPAKAAGERYKWLDDRFILIVLESLDSLFAQDIAFLPYQQEILSNLATVRDIELSFVGKLSHLFLPQEHVRGSKMLEFKNRYNNSQDIVIGDTADLIHSQFKSHHEVMSRSKFTLCPAGYGRWTFRFIESLLLGSVPILLSDDYVLPFSDVVEWNKYCYVVPESDIFNIPDLVRTITPEELACKQAAIAKDKHIFTKTFSLNQIENRLRIYTSLNKNYI
jgi:hypothetical protein